jgi:hypothetical protein
LAENLPTLAGTHKTRRIFGEYFLDLSNYRCPESNEPKLLFLKIVIEALLAQNPPTLTGTHKTRRIIFEIFRDLSKSRCDESNELKFLFLKTVVDPFLKNSTRYIPRRLTPYFPQPKTVNNRPEKAPKDRLPAPKDP